MTKPETSKLTTLLQINKKNVVEITCKSCNFSMKDYTCKNCPNCTGSLEWLCKCGARRSYSNLSVHSCEKTSKRLQLKEKFAAKKKQVIQRIEKEITNEKTVTEQVLMNVLKEEEKQNTSPTKSSKLDKMKIENLLS
jgi:Ribonuclease G/E